MEVSLYLRLALRASAQRTSELRPSKTRLDQEFDMARERGRHEAFSIADLLSVPHKRLEGLIEDNCLPCGWCTVSFKRCFTCIMEETDEESKRKHWRKLLNHQHFKAAPNARWQDIQIHFIASINTCMSNTYVCGYHEFKGVEDFKRFLLVIRADVILAEIFTLKKKPHEIKHPEWPCVSYYCMTLLGALITPLDMSRLEQYDRKFFRDANATANRIAKIEGVLDTIVACLEGARDLVELIRACSVLTCFAGASQDVADTLAKKLSIPVLINLFTAGNFTKMVAKRREKPYPQYVKILLSLAVRDVVDEVDPETMSDDDCFTRMRKRGHSVTENSGQLLYNISSLGPASATVVYEWPGFLSAWLKWLRQPALLADVDQATMGSAASLLHIFLLNRVLAKSLVEERNLLGLLERIVFMPLYFPLEKYLACVKTLLSHGNLFVDKLSQHAHLLFALGCYIHSPVRNIQEQAMPVIATLYKVKPHVIKYLHDQGVITCALMYRLTESPSSDDVTTWSTLITQRAKRHLGHKWCMKSEDLAKPASQKDLTWERLKEEGNKWFQRCDYTEALRWYKSGIVVAPSGRDRALLHSNSAECYLRIDKPEHAVRECTMAIAADFEESPVYIKTLFRRAKAFDEVGSHFEALSDISVCLWKKPNDEQFLRLHDYILWRYKEIPDAVYKLHECGECGWVGEGHKKCAKCLQAYFCSSVCQRRAWPLHKLGCSRYDVHGNCEKTHSDGKNHHSNGGKIQSDGKNHHRIEGKTQSDGKNHHGNEGKAHSAGKNHHSNGGKTHSDGKNHHRNGTQNKSETSKGKHSNDCTYLDSLDKAFEHITGIKTPNTKPSTKTRTNECDDSVSTKTMGDNASPLKSNLNGVTTTRKPTKTKNHPCFVCGNAEKENEPDNSQESSSHDNSEESSSTSSDASTISDDAIYYDPPLPPPFDTLNQEEQQSLRDLYERVCDVRENDPLFREVPRQGPSSERKKKQKKKKASFTTRPGKK